MKLSDLPDIGVPALKHELDAKANEDAALAEAEAVTNEKPVEPYVPPPDLRGIDEAIEASRERLAAREAARKPKCSACKGTGWILNPFRGGGGAAGYEPCLVCTTST